MATLNVKNLPDSLYRRLRKRAVLERRSVAQQVTKMIEEGLAEPETRSLSELRGLGRELWQGVDAAGHVEQERRDWDR